MSYILARLQPSECPTPSTKASSVTKSPPFTYHARSLIVSSLVAMAIGLWVVWGGLPDITDSHGYLCQAQNLLNLGSRYADTWNVPYRAESLALRPPLYAALVAAGWAVAGTPAAIVPLQLGLAVWNLAAVHRLLALCNIPLRCPWLIALAACLSPGHWIYAGTLMTETISESLMTGTILAMVTYWRSRRVSWLVGACLLYAAGILVKPVLMPAWPLVAIGGVVACLRGRLAWQGMLATCLPGVVVLLVCMANARQTGAFEYTSVPSGNLLAWNARFTLMDRLSQAEAERIVFAREARIIQEPDLATREAMRRREGLSIVLGDLPATIRAHGAGMIKFIIEPGRLDVDRLMSRADAEHNFAMLHVLRHEGIAAVWRRMAPLGSWATLYLMMATVMNVAAAIAMGRLAFDQRIDAGPRWLILGTITYLAVLVGSLGCARYRVPVQPLFWFALAVATTSGSPRESRSDPSGTF